MTKKKAALPLPDHELSVEDLLSAPKSPIFEARIKHAGILRMAGNDAFKTDDIESAKQLYEKSLYHSNFENAKASFDFTDKHRGIITEARNPVWLNLARCALKTKNYREAIEHLNNVECTDNETAVKFHKLLASAKLNLGDFDGSMEQYNSAKMFSPDDKSIDANIANVMKLIKLSKQHEKKLFQGIYQPSPNVKVQNADDDNIDVKDNSLVLIVLVSLIVAVLSFVTYSMYDGPVGQ